jgi:hypothetical protein
MFLALIIDMKQKNDICHLDKAYQKMTKFYIWLQTQLVNGLLDLSP